MAKRKIVDDSDDGNDNDLPGPSRPPPKTTNGGAELGDSSSKHERVARKLKTKMELAAMKPNPSTKRKKENRRAAASQKGKGKAIDDDDEMDVDEAEVPPLDTDVNAARRLKRSTQYDPAAELRKLPAVGRAQASRVGADWIRHFQELGRPELTRRQAADKTYGDDLQCIQAIVAAHCDSHGHTPILNTSAAWNGLPAAALAAIARSPTDIDVQELVVSNVFVQSHFGKAGDEGEEDDELEDNISDDGEHVMRYYARVIAVKGDKGRQALLNYVAASPENTPHAFLQLLLVGTSPKDAVALCRDAVSHLGLESAVDMFASSILHDPLTQHLVALAPSKPPSSFLYLGLTTKVPGQRAVNDLDVGTHVRFVHFCRASPNLTVTTYHIPSLDIPLTTQYEQRTNAVISERERILVSLGGEVTLNSARGGFLPIHHPSSELRSLRDLVFQSLPNDCPLGVERKPDIEQAVLALLDDELQALPEWQTSRISESHIDYIKQSGLGVIRFKKGRLVRLSLMKDSTNESLRGDVPGYFDVAVGPGPSEDRRVRRHLNPNIPEGGDLDTSTIARYVGPFVNFWRLVLLHILYWLHLLWLLRFLHLLQPIVIHTQSNILAKLFASGILAESDLAPPEFFNGCTSPGLLQIRPRMTPPRFTEDEFSEYTGTIHLVPYGPGAKLTLHVAGADYGSLKYEPQLASTRWPVLFLVALVVEVLTRVVSLQLDQVDADFDWTKEVQVRGLLTAMKVEADMRLEVAGVTAALEAAKATAREREFVANFLRCLARSRRTHEHWAAQSETRGDQGPRPRAKVFKVKPSGDQRHAQLQQLEEHADRLVSYGLWPDPHHLESYGRTIGSEPFRLWFLALADGTDAVYSANAEGKTEEAAANAQASRRRILDHQPGREDPLAQQTRHIKNAVQDTAVPPSSYNCKELETRLRFGICDTCDQHVVCPHAQVFHDCNGSQTITLRRFSNLEPGLYPHDFLDDESFRNQLGGIKSARQQLNMEAYKVRDIIQRNHAPLRTALPNPSDFNAVIKAAIMSADARVYALEGAVTEDFLLTMAVDVILRDKHTAPAEFEPFGDARSAWSRPTHTARQVWLSTTSERAPLYAFSCQGPQGQHRQHVFVTDKTTVRTGDGKRLAKNVRCVHCDSKACNPRHDHPIQNLLDFPYHFSRQMWFGSQIPIDYPPVRPTKTNKKQR